MSLLDRVDAINTRARELTDGLSEHQLQQTPPDGGWSLAQIFEHLLVSHGLYLEKLRPLIAGAPRTPPRRPWRPSWIGKLLIRAMEPSAKRRRTQRIFTPGAPRPRVVHAFLEMQREFADLLEAAQGLDWNALRLTSPVSRLIPINLGDALTVLVMHAERHLQQAARVRAQVA